MTAFHSLSPHQAIKALQSTPAGLTQAEAEKRLKTVGYNEIKARKRKTPAAMLASQFTNFLIIILIAAAITSAFMGEALDAEFIIAIVVLNAVFGFAQEYRAEKAIEALKKMIAPKARVIRDGTEKQLPATHLVPGDIIIIQEGDSIPADCRLITTTNFYCQEASLTGESLPVEKNADAILPQNTPTTDQINTAFTGTTAVRGHATAIVTATGMNTQIGSIAKIVAEEKEEETPLQRRLEVLGKQIGAAALAICAAIFAAGILRGQPPLEMFLIAVSLAVAAVPEGLPAIVTITLAIGVQRMARRNAIIRKLASVETLGSATVICTDKTGTLTKNEMTIREIHANAETIKVTGEGYSLQGTFHSNEKEVYAAGEPHLSELIKIGVVCNNADLATNTENNNAAVLGDPTEAAFLVLAAKAGIDYKQLRSEHEIINEIPFDSERKMMTKIAWNQKTKQKIAFTKGAPENVLQCCSHALLNGKETPLTDKERAAILEANKQMACQALRVLALAYRRLPETTTKYSPANTEKDLVFVGLAGMIDPPRPEAKKAIQLCKTAGIKVVMITGDNEATATAIAKELGIATPNSLTLTSAMLDKMSDEELAQTVESVSVYARVTPQHKNRIVAALQKNGEIVAMTGDGVNDAPALKKADIGIAMGVTGTDVAKQASSMVLADDNFASIVNAVQEGRTIYDNILKSIRYLLSCNAGEIITIFAATLAAIPNPLTPIQILWMNLVTDGLPALALGMDPPEKDVMKRLPRNPKEKAINRHAAIHMLTIAVFMALGTLAIYGFYFPQGEAKARTAAFTAIIFFQIFIALDSRSLKHSIAQASLLANKALLAAIGVAVALQIAVTHLPAAQTLFGTTALAPLDWTIITLASASILAVSELRKRFAK
ncbi:MAG: calcium-translocating P-type ATPase, SERCA-type [Candidatus Micrarchaeia archaeon]|jgi:Ca2+-transporting ATPase